MKLISHRGNLDGKNPEMENKPEYIMDALNLDYDVEIDIWFIDNIWYLGHDEPTYKIDFYEFIYNVKNLWLHCKNIESFNELVTLSKSLKINWINYFWHQNDDYTLTSNGYIWTYPGKQLMKNSISVLPEKNDLVLKDIEHCYGVCSDYIKKYKDVNDKD